MSSIPILIQQQNHKIAALQAAIQGSIDRGLLYAVTGDHVLYGCKVTQGASATDMYVALSGNSENPDQIYPAGSAEQYPNIAFVFGRAFLSEDLNTISQTVEALHVEAAPATAGYGRYDLVYVYVDSNGPLVGIVTGTASASITSLSTAVYPVSGDPVLPQGCLELARLYVPYGATGVATAQIADLRNFAGRLQRASTVAPASATDTGIAGEIRVTSTHVYTCVATNTWKRAAVASW